jgi:hypothetical protein
MMPGNKRVAPRREITPLQVSSVSSLENLAKISRSGEIVEASTTGFLLVVKREDLIPSALRKNLTLDVLIGTKILLHLPQMNLEISGRIARTKLLGLRTGANVWLIFSRLRANSTSSFQEVGL